LTIDVIYGRDRNIRLPLPSDLPDSDARRFEEEPDVLQDSNRRTPDRATTAGALA